MGGIQQVNPCKQQFHNVNKVYYRGYEINLGVLFNGETAYEAFNATTGFGFYRRSYQLIKEAIDVYQFSTTQILNDEIN